MAKSAIAIQAISDSQQNVIISNNRFIDGGGAARFIPIGVSNTPARGFSSRYLTIKDNEVSNSRGASAVTHCIEVNTNTTAAIAATYNITDNICVGMLTAS